MKLKVKIYHVDTDVDVAMDWGLQAQSVTAQEALQQRFSIACVPACYTRAWNFAYRSNHPKVDLSKFDLVIVSDIEQERISDIDNWTQELKITNFVAALGAYHNSETIDPQRMIFRPWWMYNMMRLNTDQPRRELSQDRDYWFDVLLGARRPHRDFVMLNLQKHSLLLEKSLVTYRSGFIGEIIDEQTKHIHSYFANLQLQWPYVSPTLKPEWEVQAAFDKSMSPYVPWKIYDQAWYSVVCETSFTGDSFFPTEKISKAMYAGRIFVVFAPCQYLKYLRELGFKTFSDIIDESYDEDLVDLERYKKAWAEMISLTYQHPKEVYEKMRPVLEHNRRHMDQLLLQTKQKMQDLLRQKIPAEFISDDES